MGRLASFAFVALVALVALGTPLVPGGAGGLAAQDDVVQLGEVYGTRPPRAYLEFRARNPGSFEFSRALLRRNPQIEVLPGSAERFRVRDLLPPAEAGAAGAFGMRSTSGQATSGGSMEGGSMAGGSTSGSSPFDGPVGRFIGPRDRVVEGEFAFPLILGYFADDSLAPVYGLDAVQREFFDGPNSRGQTITEFYAELSSGRVSMIGEAQDWRQASLTRDSVTAGVSGLAGGRVVEFIHSILEQVDDGSIDWGRYDNDGPDGVPNSGDDDGFVDVLTVFHPTQGAECGGAGRQNRIWSHRWSLSSAGMSAGSPLREYATSSAAAGGGVILVNDYTVQPVLSCDGVSINEIGVFAHELGHGFGLPDLYCTSPGCSSVGIGRWGLMGSGSWGCDSFNPAQPCHMSAWSKAMLGWVDVAGWTPDRGQTQVVLPAVQNSGQVLRVDALDGSGDYLLLENRQRLGSDGDLAGTGLLVWRIDQDWLTSAWPSNAVNALRTRQGVALLQADGRSDLLAGVNRADAGDPFPGAANRTALHAATTPATRTHTGEAAGITLTDITEQGREIMFDLLQGYRTVRVEVSGATTEGLVRVDDEPVPLMGGLELQSAPFESHVFRADSAEAVADRIRRPFVGWGDGGSSAPLRTIITGSADASFVATYGPEQVQLQTVVDGGALGVSPGVVATSPLSNQFWFDIGSTIQLTARPTSGFDFLGWSGALTGTTNPGQWTAQAPATVTARFTLGFEGLAAPLLGSGALDPRLDRALDEAGNRNGVYDVGDLRAWLLAVDAGSASAAVVEAMRGVR